MIEHARSPYLVPFDGSFKIKDAPSRPPEDAPPKKKCEKLLEDIVKDTAKIQAKLNANDRHALLLIFQAMDASGKDGTVRAVMSGVNPAGCQVYNFKQPSAEELDHDFLWRTTKCLPERGRIGIFNRSYYEPVLVVRVHPEYLADEKLPGADLDTIWEERYESIREHERHLARNGTVVVKFWLNVSQAEQRKRLLDRIEDEDANWKFSGGDIKERALWPKYMDAYEAALNATSRPWAPWYAIPADSKAFMRLQVAQVVLDTLKNIDPKFPEVSKEQRKQLKEFKRVLEEEGGGAESRHEDEGKDDKDDKDDVD